jgi:Na+-translocating ferredoxin:NAD+ oxidoreductase subunit B
MNPLIIVIPIAALGILGAVFAVLLALSNKAFAVHIDPKIEGIFGSLPGSNCGACGYAGCLGLAEAIAAGKAEADGCVAGGNATAQKVAEILGVSLEPQTEFVAFVACRAGRSSAAMRYEYQGVRNCQSAHLMYGGDKACAWGCLGLGSCERACPFDAIHVNGDGLAVVDRVKCRSCKKCVAACPRRLISMVPKSQDVLVACMNHDRGNKVKLVCSIGCTACKICEKNCPDDAIHVVLSTAAGTDLGPADNLAVIDFAKCTQCGTCVEKCPQASIVSISGKYHARKKEAAASAVGSASSGESGGE